MGSAGSEGGLDALDCWKISSLKSEEGSAFAVVDEAVEGTGLGCAGSGTGLAGGLDALNY